jgi:putative phage-type endonuclease
MCDISAIFGIEFENAKPTLKKKKDTNVNISDIFGIELEEETDSVSTKNINIEDTKSNVSNMSTILAKLGKTKLSNTNEPQKKELVVKEEKKGEDIKEKQHDDIWDKEHVRISKIVQALSDIEYPAQRSPKWFEMREGSITASDAGCVLGHNSHEPAYKIYVKKIQKPPFEASMFCYHGTKYEQIATMRYEFVTNVIVTEYGLVKHAGYNFLAVSPDGICGPYKSDGVSKTKQVGVMLEIKCPAMRKIRDDDPFFGIPYYKDQVLLQMEVCNLEVCDFWQNKITEYGSREDFVDDTDPDTFYKSRTTGMEKGCIIQLLPKDKMSGLLDDYENIICGFTKFLYPPKMDMTVAECDAWIATSLQNIEKTLIDDVMKKYNAMHEIIQNSITNNEEDFLNFMNTELEAAIKHALHDNEWKFKNKPDSYINKIKKSVREDAVRKFINEYTDFYPRKLMEPLKNENLIRYLVKINSKKKYTDLINDVDLIKKMIDLNANPEFFKRIDQDLELKFVKKLCELLKDLEFPKNYTFDRSLYWRFEKSLCTPVARDRKWFAESLPVFEKTWSNITFLRENLDVSKLVFDYIDALPVFSEDHGKVLKDSDKVMEFVNFICDKPTDNKKLEKYNKKIQNFFDEIA